MAFSCWRFSVSDLSIMHLRNIGVCIFKNNSEENAASMGLPHLKGKLFKTVDTHWQPLASTHVFIHMHPTPMSP